MAGPSRARRPAEAESLVDRADQAGRAAAMTRAVFSWAALLSAICPSGTTTQDWAEAVAWRIGAHNDTAVTFLVAWAHGEGGGGANARWNPLNTTMPRHASTHYNANGVRSYRSMRDGIAATVKTLRLPHAHYPAIVAALRAGDFAAARRAVIDSPWGTTRFVLVTDAALVTDAMRGRDLAPPAR